VTHAAGERAVVTTANRGASRARVVVVATEAWSAKLFPQLKGLVIPSKSHIGVWRGVRDRLHGYTVNTHHGDGYNNIPVETKYVKDGDMMGDVVGGFGLDIPHDNPDDYEILPEQWQNRRWVGEVIPEAREREPDLAWAGNFAISPDKMPVLGPLADDPNDWSVLLDVASQGYGGAWGTALAHVTADAADAYLRLGPLAAQRVYDDRASLADVGLKRFGGNACVRLLNPPRSLPEEP
jgi:glycine/D-amino acid oxidase-like deaminating enzyme